MKLYDRFLERLKEIKECKGLISYTSSCETILELIARNMVEVTKKKRKKKIKGHYEFDVTYVVSQSMTVGDRFVYDPKRPLQMWQQPSWVGRCGVILDEKCYHGEKSYSVLFDDGFKTSVLTESIVKEVKEFYTVYV